MKSSDSSQWPKISWNPDAIGWSYNYHIVDLKNARLESFGTFLPVSEGQEVFTLPPGEEMRRSDLPMANDLGKDFRTGLGNRIIGMFDCF
jgi:hypothetical protein